MTPMSSIIAAHRSKTGPIPGGAGHVLTTEEYDAYAAVAEAVQASPDRGACDPCIYDTANVTCQACAQWRVICTALDNLKEVLSRD